MTSAAGESAPAAADRPEEPVRYWIVAEAGLVTFVAVCVVHVFAGPIEPVAAFAVHAALITAVYTGAFALTYLLLQRLRPHPFVRAMPQAVLVPVLSAVACLAGGMVLGLMKQAGGDLGSIIDVHDDANWALKLAPVWLVLTVVLFQSERARLLESELRRLSASRAQIKLRENEDPARQIVRVGERIVNVGSGKAVHALCIDDVSHAVAVENYCEVHFVEQAKQKPLLIRTTLATLLEDLPADFARTHRSYVVNLARIDSIAKSGRAYSALLGDGRSVPVSRNCIDDVSARWRTFLKAGTA